MIFFTSKSKSWITRSAVDLASLGSWSLFLEICPYARPIDPRRLVHSCFCFLGDVWGSVSYVPCRAEEESQGIRSCPGHHCSFWRGFLHHPGRLAKSIYVYVSRQQQHSVCRARESAHRFLLPWWLGCCAGLDVLFPIAHQSDSNRVLYRDDSW
jgi:hypothetical protein